MPEPRVRKRPYKKVKVTVMTTREPAVTENDLDQGMQCILSIFIKYNQPKSFKFNAVVKNDIFSGMCEYMQKRRFCCKFPNMRSKKFQGIFGLAKRPPSSATLVRVTSFNCIVLSVSPESDSNCLV